MKVAAIIVTYNRKELLAECMTAVLGQRAALSDIYVIDNASTDGTQKMVQEFMVLHPEILYKNTGDNIGGAGGFSYGINCALSRRDYDYVWLMDDDTIPSDAALEKLLEAAEQMNGTGGFFASSVLWTDGSPCRMNQVAAEKDQIGEGMELHACEGQNAGNYMRISRATFVSVLVNACAIREVGLPIRQFFIWGDDQEYTERISKRYPCYYVPESTVIHKMKTNVGSCIWDDEADRIGRYQYAFRNDLYRAKRNGWHAVKPYLIHILRCTYYILAKSPGKRWRRLWALYAGFLRGIFFHPQIEYIHGAD